jgi:osmotically-inducible protein OsmY
VTQSPRKLRWILLLLPLLASPLLTVGCATNQPVGQQIDDAAITAAVKANLAKDDDVAAHNIDVDTLDGVVTLSGIVDSWNERSEAARIAAATDDVRSVVNNLQVKTS